MFAASSRAWILLPLMVSACATTRHVPMTPQTSRELSDYSVVVLTRGSRVPLIQGRLTADSVIGERENGGRFAVSRDSVATVQESSVSIPRTLGLVGGIALGVYALLGLAVSSAEWKPAY